MARQELKEQYPFLDDRSFASFFSNFLISLLDLSEEIAFSVEAKFKAILHFFLSKNNTVRKDSCFTETRRCTD